MNCFKYKPKFGYGLIYKYTSPSGKSYIGQTIQSLSERAGRNGQKYTNCSIFFKAIEKYGFDNFTYEILEEVEIERLDERETFYIYELNTIQPNGYNIQKGGNQDYKTKRISKSTPVVKYSSEGIFLANFDSVSDAAREAGTHYQTIEEVLRRERSHYKGFIYRYLGEDAPAPIKIIETHGKSVSQFDLNGKYIATYSSAYEAARAVGKNSNAGRNIRSVCQGERQSAYGFIWKNLD